MHYFGVPVSRVGYHGLECQCSLFRQKIFFVEFWITFSLTISLKNLSQDLYLTFNLNSLFLTFVVCFDLPVVGASSSAPEEKLINNKCQKKRSKLKVKYKSWERFFSEMVRLNVIQNSTKKKFCLKSEHWRSFPCHPSLN